MRLVAQRSAGRTQDGAANHCASQTMVQRLHHCDVPRPPQRAPALRRGGPLPPVHCAFFKHERFANGGFWSVEEPVVETNQMRGRDLADTAQRRRRCAGQLRTVAQVQIK